MQRQSERDSSVLTHELGEKCRLVEATFAFPRRMQRHRHKQVEAATAQTEIIERFGQPSRDGMPQLTLAPVFEIMD